MLPLKRSLPRAFVEPWAAAAVAVAATASAAGMGQAKLVVFCPAQPRLGLESNTSHTDWWKRIEVVNPVASHVHRRNRHSIS